MADLVIENATIHTLNSARPTARAVAVQGGRIVAVGEDVSQHIDSATKRIDAQGATLVPGFVDSHAHLRGLGAQLENLDLRHASSLDEIAAVIRQSASSLPASEWIIGRNWDQTRWGGDFPTEAPLTEAAPDHPVFLTRVDGHASWANRKALELAGITAATPDPPGGRIIRDARGQPTGILIDRAQELVRSKMPPLTDEAAERQIARAARECARLGLTSIHDAGITEQDLAAYRSLLRKGELPVRVYAMIGGDGPLWREFLKKGPEIGEMLTIRSIKLMADGALGSRGAALLEPYADDPGNTGLLLLDRNQIERIAREAVSRGFQVNTHAIGDRANRVVLEAYANVLGGRNNRRFRIEHAQIVASEDFPLFAENSVIASVQATHCTSDMRWAEARVGSSRLQGAYAWRTFLEHGIPVANGSDFPVEDPDPLWGFYSSVTRQDHDGEPRGGWRPAERLTRDEALRSWTLTGAYAAFEEDRKGSIEPGNLADLVLLSKDILAVPERELLQTRVLLTIIGGEVVHSELP